MNMTNEYSGLPNGILYTPHNFEDASDDLALIINKVNDLQLSGKYEEAAEYISSAEIQSAIKKTVITADIINAIEEEIRNIEIKANSSSQQIFYSDDVTTPSNLISGDIWISRLTYDDLRGE